MHRLLITLLWAALLMPATVRAQDTAFPEIPSLSVVATPADLARTGAYVQGQIVLRVQIASRYPFEALDLDLPEIANARVIRLLKPRTHRRKSYAGDGYVFETALALFPTVSGPFRIPEIRASGRVQTPDGRDILFNKTNAVQQIIVHGIAPDFTDPWWLVSPRISLTETWSKPLGEIRVGDIVTRSITATAEGVMPDQMPTLEHGRTQGIIVADKGTTSTSQQTVDGITTTLTRSWTLKIDRDGVVYISPVGLAYWDPVARVRAKAAVPGHRLEPLPVDAREIAARLMADAENSFHTNRIALFTLTAIMLAPAAVLVILLIWQMRPTPPDRRLIRGCRDAATPLQAYGEIRRWARETGRSADPPETLFPGSVRSLERAAFTARPGPADPARAARDLTRMARRERLAGLRRGLRAMVDQVLGPAPRI